MLKTHGPDPGTQLATQLGNDQRQLAVLVALRHGAREPFSDRDRRNLQLLADQISPSFG